MQAGASIKRAMQFDWTRISPQATVGLNLIIKLRLWATDCEGLQAAKAGALLPDTKPIERFS
jgi:hypothetical protein